MDINQMREIGRNVNSITNNAHLGTREVRISEYARKHNYTAEDFLAIAYAERVLGSQITHNLDWRCWVELAKIPQKRVRDRTIARAIRHGMMPFQVTATVNALLAGQNQPYVKDLPKWLTYVCKERPPMRRLAKIAVNDLEIDETVLELRFRAAALHRAGLLFGDEDHDKELSLHVGRIHDTMVKTKTVLSIIETFVLSEVLGRGDERVYNGDKSVTSADEICWNLSSANGSARMSLHKWLERNRSDDGRFRNDAYHVSCAIENAADFVASASAIQRHRKFFLTSFSFSAVAVVKLVPEHGIGSHWACALALATFEALKVDSDEFRGLLAACRENRYDPFYHRMLGEWLAVEGGHPEVGELVMSLWPHLLPEKTRKKERHRG